MGDLETLTDRSATNPLAGRRVVFLSHLDRNLHRFRLPIMKALVALDCEVWVLIPPGEHDSAWARYGVRVAHYPVKRGSLSIIGAVRAVIEIRRRLRIIRPDLVHTFTVTANLFGTLGARLADVPIIVNSVTGIGSLVQGRAIGVRLQAAAAGVRVMLRANRSAVTETIFQNSDDLAFFLDRKLACPAKSRVIRGSGVDPAHFDPRKVSPEVRRRTRQDLGMTDDALVVTMIARLIYDKGVMDFLEAAERLDTSETKIQFMLVGAADPGNPSRLRAEDLDRLHRSPALTLPGRRSDIRECLAASDLYVLCSRYREGLPRTNLEAMAMALPVITTDVPGCRETVEDGRNGVLVPPGDSERLANTIDGLLQAPATRRSMGTESRKMILEHFAAGRVVDEHLALYRDLLTGDLVERSQDGLAQRQALPH